VAVAHHGGHAGQGGQLIRRALGIAAGNDNPCFGIEPVGAADKRAGGAVSLGRYAASIDNHHVGRCWFEFAKPCCAQVAAHRLAIGAGGTAAKMFDVKSRHKFSVLRFSFA
jgi:hypothetical protein